MLLALLSFLASTHEPRPECSGAEIGPEIFISRADGEVGVVSGCGSHVRVECPWEVVVTTPDRAFLRDGDEIAFDLIPGAAPEGWSASCRIVSAEGVTTVELIALE